MWWWVFNDYFYDCVVPRMHFHWRIDSSTIIDPSSQIKPQSTKLLASATIHCVILTMLWSEWAYSTTCNVRMVNNILFLKPDYGGNESVILWQMIKDEKFPGCYFIEHRYIFFIICLAYSCQVFITTVRGREGYDSTFISW